MKSLQIKILLAKTKIYKTLLGLCCFLGLHLAQAQIPIIFDTDFGGDADDLGALAMLNHFKNKGEIELLAVMCWNTEKYAVSAIDATNTFYGNPDVPIAVRKDDPHETDWNHSKAIVDKLPYDALFETVPETTELYRKILGESEDNSLVIVTVGPLMNIKRLIDSPPDQHSTLQGLDLIHAKVKEFVIMGGNFPNGKNEWNFDGGMPGVTQYVLEKLALPITFSGAELGSAIKTGEVFNALPQDSPLYLGFYHFSQHAPWVKEGFKGKIQDNSTFDQTAVLYAVRNGIGEYWKRSKAGICIPDQTGGNSWETKEGAHHSYLLLTKPKAEIEKELQAFMLGDF
ncbi:MAG: nucleoside hydrolase [Bacteroidota bacterium]